MTNVKAFGVLAVVVLVLVIALIGTMMHVEKIRVSHNALVEKVAKLEKMQKAPHEILRVKRIILDDNMVHGDL